MSEFVQGSFWGFLFFLMGMVWLVQEMITGVQEIKRVVHEIHKGFQEITCMAQEIVSLYLHQLLAGLQYFTGWWGGS